MLVLGPNSLEKIGHLGRLFKIPWLLRSEVELDTSPLGMYVQRERASESPSQIPRGEVYFST